MELQATRLSILEIETMSSNTMAKATLANLDEGFLQSIKPNCQRCGECCSRFLPMTDVDAKDFLMLLERHIKQDGLKLNEYMMFCPLFDWPERSCTVYGSPFRPQICGAFKCRTLKYPSTMAYDQMFTVRNMAEGNVSIVDTFDLYEIALENLERGKRWTT